MYELKRKLATLGSDERLTSDSKGKRDWSSRLKQRQIQKILFLAQLNFERSMLSGSEKTKVVRTG